MTRLYRYSIRTTDGQRVLVNATDLHDAIRKSGIAPELIRPWYPFCLEALATEEEKAETKKRLAALKEKKLGEKRADQQKQAETERREAMNNNCSQMNHPPKPEQLIDLEDLEDLEERDLENSTDFWIAPKIVNGHSKGKGDTTGILPEIPARTIPTGGLRPKKAQTDKPLPLEMPAINEKQRSLF